MDTTSTVALERVIRELGSQRRLAEVVGTTQQAISYALKNSRPVRAEWCPKIEEATGGRIRKHELRPDLFMPEAA